MKYQLIQSGEKYAVRRKGWFLGGNEYADLAAWPHVFWWGKRDKYFRDCWSTKERAEQVFQSLFVRPFGEEEVVIKEAKP